MPRAEFVQSLAFFVSDESTLGRLKQSSAAMENTELQKSLVDLEALQLELKKVGDLDLSALLDPLRNLMKLSVT